MDRAELMRAYQDCVIGAESPTHMVVSGELILQQQPDLKDIDPVSLYLVTKDKIQLIEDL